jgi:hypothetical protein
MVAWPSTSSTTLGLAFLGRSRVTQVCLKSWKRAEWGQGQALLDALDLLISLAHRVRVYRGGPVHHINEYRLLELGL